MANNDDRKLPSAPMAIDPAYNSVRIAVQRGTFTVFGKNRRPIDDYSAMRERCVKIIVPKSHTEEVGNQLFWAGIRETSVFPELDGVSKDISDYYRGTF